MGYPLVIHKIQKKYERNRQTKSKRNSEIILLKRENFSWLILMKTELDLRATGLNEQKSELLSRVVDMNRMFRRKSCIIVQIKTGLSFDDR